MSDDFNSCAGLRPHWTIVDPLADAAFDVVGAGTDAARLSIDVPGGNDHDARGVNFAPRVVQAVADRDLSLEVSFDSQPAFPGQFQGLLFQQDPRNWILFDVRAGAGGLFVSAKETTEGVTADLWLQAMATPIAGGPLKMRIERKGNAWTQSVSADGIQWEAGADLPSEKPVATIGVIAGNGGADPQPFTALCDYVQSASAPLGVEDGEIDFGPFTVTTGVRGQGEVAVTPQANAYACGELVELLARPAPNWKLEHWEGDAAGNANPLRLVLESDRHVVAVFVVDTDPPLITDVHAVTGVRSATITWRTNEPATSRVDYGPTSSYGQTAQSPALVRDHRIVVGGLIPGSIYHFAVRSTDGAGHETVAPDAIFQTAPAAQLTSDDFSGFNLDRDVWTFVDPLSTGSLRLVGAGTGDARLELGVPAGTSHDPYGTNPTPRVMQSMQNVDFDVATRFDSVLQTRFQIQGIIVEDDAANWMRFDLYYDGSRVRLYAGTNQNGVPSTKGNEIVQDGAWGGGALYLRVTRVGNHWTAGYSYDGVAWVTAIGPFTHSITVRSIGPFVGNAATGTNNPPAHTALVDWFFDLSNPVPDEDGTVAPDDDAPFVYRVEAFEVTGNSATVRWHSDERVSGWIEYGRTTGYELGTTPIVGPSWSPAVQINGLSPETTYFYRIVSEDAYLQRTVSTGHSFVTSTGAGGGEGEGPQISLWYGTDTGSAIRQRFGHLGHAQTWINVLGRVDTVGTGFTSIEYSLNGGPARPLNVGPDSRRLYGTGDFNVEIAYSDLLPGDNDVFITSRDNTGRQRRVHVIAEYLPTTAPTSFVVDPAASNDIQDLVQVVDGRWSSLGASFQPLERGYDRLFAVGDVLHDNYEVTLRLTAFSVDPEGYASPSNGPAVGMGLRWIGHGGNQQPRRDFWPTGAFAWYRWTTNSESFQLRTNGYAHGSFSSQPFLFGVPYTFKARVSTQADGRPLYRFKFWTATEIEPPLWNLEVAGDVGDPSRGSVLILSHHVDVDFGTITVAAVPPEI